MRKMIIGLFSVLGMLFLTGTARAHFGMVIPSDNMVMQQDHRSVTLTLSFSHPFEGQGMILEKPKAFGVLFEGKSTELLPRLQPARVMGQKAWQMDFVIKRPGVYTIFMEPRPYWEEAEDGFIVHYTKTVVAAFGDDENWGAEVGLKTEIVPLSKPFGLYAGNVFQGVVKLNGKAVPYAEVEIEYYNRDKKYQAPTDYMVTQTIKADGKGVFTYAVPWSGWWGFAALNTAGYALKHNGEEKPVELGAVMWVKFEKPIKP